MTFRRQNLKLFLTLQYLFGIFSLVHASTRRITRAIDEHQPTVFYQNPFDPAEDAKRLYKALEGFGVDERTIIEILPLRANEQRLDIAKEYRKLYKSDLTDALGYKLQGELKDLVLSLMTPLAHYYANELHAAIERFKRKVGYDVTWQCDCYLFQRRGCGQIDEDLEVILEILRLENEQIRRVNDAYKKCWGNYIEDDIKGILPVMDYGLVTPPYFSQKLYKALSGSVIDHHTLIRIVVTRSEYDLANIAEYYQATYGKPLTRAISDALGKGAQLRQYKRALIFLLGER